MAGASKRLGAKLPSAFTPAIRQTERPVDVGCRGNPPLCVIARLSRARQAQKFR